MEKWLATEGSPSQKTRNSQKHKVNEDGLGKAVAVSEQQPWYSCINSSWRFDFTVHQLLSLLAIWPSADKANAFLFLLTLLQTLLSSMLWFPFFWCTKFPVFPASGTRSFCPLLLPHSTSKRDPSAQRMNLPSALLYNLKYFYTIRP